MPPARPRQFSELPVTGASPGIYPAEPPAAPLGTGEVPGTTTGTGAFAAGPKSAGWSGETWTFMDGVSQELRSYFIQNAMAGMRGAGELPAQGETPLITPSGGERMAVDVVTRSMDRQTIALERIAAAVERDGVSEETQRAMLAVLQTGRDMRVELGELTINLNEAAPRRPRTASRIIERTQMQRITRGGAG